MEYNSNKKHEIMKFGDLIYVIQYSSQHLSQYSSQNLNQNLSQYSS